MAFVFGSTTRSSGLINYSPAKLHRRIQRPVNSRIVSFNGNSDQSVKILKTRVRFCGAKRFVSKFSVSASEVGNQNQITGGGDVPEEPIWNILYKEAYRGLKLVIEFLMEQPSQLKYIEWPAFQSTLKTATLTLVLVALLIVALASIDSALSFLLALMLRRRS